MKNNVQKDKRISIDIPLEIHTALKVAVASNNMSIKMFIVSLIIEELNKLGFIKIK